MAQAIKTRIDQPRYWYRCSDHSIPRVNGTYANLATQHSNAIKGADRSRRPAVTERRGMKLGKKWPR